MMFLLQVSQDMGVESPITVSMKLGDTSNLFRRIINVAQRPHLSIPETEAGKNHKQYRRLINRSLMFVSGKMLYCHFQCLLKFI
jgi:Ras family protein T1